MAKSNQLTSTVMHGRSRSQIEDLLEEGASLEVSAKEFSRSQLEDFVDNAVSGGGPSISQTLTNSHHLRLKT